MRCSIEQDVFIAARSQIAKLIPRSVYELQFAGRPLQERVGLVKATRCLMSQVQKEQLKRLNPMYHAVEISKLVPLRVYQGCFTTYNAAVQEDLAVLAYADLTKQVLHAQARRGALSKEYWRVINQLATLTALGKELNYELNGRRCEVA